MLLEERFGWSEQGLEFLSFWTWNFIVIHDFRKYQKRLVEIMEGYIHQIKSRILVIAKTGFIVPMTKTEMASQNAGRKLMI